MLIADIIVFSILKDIVSSYNKLHNYNLIGDTYQYSLHDIKFNLNGDFFPLGCLKWDMLSNEWTNMYSLHDIKFNLNGDFFPLGCLKCDMLLNEWTNMLESIEDALLSLLYVH